MPDATCRAGLLVDMAENVREDTQWYRDELDAMRVASEDHRQQYAILSQDFNNFRDAYSDLELRNYELEDENRMLHRTLADRDDEIRESYEIEYDLRTELHRLATVFGDVGIVMP